MFLSELYDQLLPLFKLSMQKDVKTTVGYLAKALDCPDPQHCSPELYNQPLPTLYRLIEDYLTAQGKTLDTIRNTKNFTSRLFREAEKQHLFSLVPVSLTPAYDPYHKPSRPGAVHNQRHATYLIYAQWSPELQAAYTAFQTWATAPLVSGRPSQLRKRFSTMEDYKKTFQAYFGYLAHIEHLVPTFDHLFDISLVTNYVHWHVNDCHQRTTVTIRQFLTFLLALTRQYRPLPELRSQLQALRKTLPVPAPVYNKVDAWVSLAQLSEIGRTLWPRKKPYTRSRTVTHPGLHFAQRATLSLMLQLWTYIPYRQRNIREMLLDENLYKDAQKLWRIRFQGEQLKVATKRGRINVFDLPFPPALVSLLEDYLKTWRPILLAKAEHPDVHVFLTTEGTPYSQRLLTQATQNTVYRFTGKYWHPHIIRSVWATEWIKKTHGDFYTAAIMLNDRLETVIANYAHLLEEDVAEKAYRLIEKRNGQGK